MSKILKIAGSLLLFSSVGLFAQSQDRIVGLQGKWKFSIGDDKNWAAESFNDNEWESIYAPSQWENQGFYGYDGFAWYRKKFTISGENKDKVFYVSLGYIDDVDEVYINGNMIGYSGSFPPKFATAYNAFRKYNIPAQLIKYDQENVIAVRVYDAQMGGGIVDGDLAVYVDKNAFPLEIDLQGMWKFKTGDNMEYKNPLYSDNNWRNITVPSFWEDQGYRDYDGFAWYRKTFLVTKSFADEKVVIVLGKIDDLDEVYLNGQYVGNPKMIADYDENEGDRYSQFRAYYVSGNLLQMNKYNVISVRVYDHGGEGGIYEGPVGIVKMKKFVNFWKTKNR
jgi:hypothetical protein